MSVFKIIFWQGARMTVSMYKLVFYVILGISLKESFSSVSLGLEQLT